MPILPPRHVFVYGTLRQGEQRDINLLTPAPRWVGRASVEGVLYDLGDYPGLVLGIDQRHGQKKVCGEVYEITRELELRLDEIEEVAPQPGGEYAKRQVLVVLDVLEPSRVTAEGEAVRALPCLVYEAASDRVSGCPVIPGGDWVGYRLQLLGRGR